MSGNHIKVVCRLRPQNMLEERKGGVPIIDIAEDGTSLHFKGKKSNKLFSFDKVYAMDTAQQVVFDSSVKSIVDDVTAGYTGTVLAYGQTCSGKTHTMMGTNIDCENSKGITPRAVDQIFTSIHQSPSNIEFTVHVSYMEIYMEKVRDLLNPSRDNLPIHEDKWKGIYVKNLLEVYVASSEDVYDVMRRAAHNRVIAYTNMNARSSRSHSIFVINITQKNVDTGAAKSGKLYLVDLAGSEEIGETVASEKKSLREAKNINKSLMALGMVIGALARGKSRHVPYRDSKLTHILQESLGGNSRTTLIINCSPSSYNEIETLSSLRLGVRARTIKNNAKINAELPNAELSAELKTVQANAVTFQTYIAALEGEVNIWRSNNTVPEEKWAKSFQSSFPTTTLEEDEREEFVKREAELVDQISETKTEIAICEKFLERINDEVDYYMKQKLSMTSENRQVTKELNNMRLQLGSASYKCKESAIIIESLEESKQDLRAQLTKLKKNMTETRAALKVANVSDKEKETQIMNRCDASNQTNEKGHENLSVVGTLDGEGFSAEEVACLRQELAESKALLEQHAKTISDLTYEKASIESKKGDLDRCLNALEQEYEELLDKAIAEEKITETIAHLKSKLETTYATKKKEMQQKEIEYLKKQLERANDDQQNLSSQMADLKVVHEQLKAALAKQLASTATNDRDLMKEKVLERMRQSMAQQAAEFGIMKKQIMRDLHARYEIVVELEMSLDETHEQYNNVLRSNNNKALQKTMSFLECKHKLITNVQEQLVEQNAYLKREASLAERKLFACNERIESLEMLVQEAHERLITEDQKFESNLQTVRERLERMLSLKMILLNF